MTALGKGLVGRACEIISDPACWTQSTAARDQRGRAVSARSNKATMFCAFGALTKAAHECGLSDRWLVEIFNVPALTQLIRANDSENHAAVLALLKRLDKEMGSTQG
jgi:hypothetical protein